MILLDRFVILRFLSNFLVLFGLLFMFVISIDVIVQFDEFSDTAEEIAEKENRSYAAVLVPVSYTHLTLPTIYSV